MKRIFTLIMALACVGMTVFAQAPSKINYQVVARDADNAVIQEQPVNVQIDILQGSATGTSVYTESLRATTNFDGLLSLEVNAGEIDWANGPYFIQTTVEGNVISTVQLMAVPYAFYTAKAATDFSGKYTDLANKPEIPVIPTKTSEYDNDVPYVTAEAQELSLDGDKLTISDGNTVDLPTANKVEYIPVNKPKAGDMLYWDNDKQEWVLISGGKPGDVLAYFEKPEWATMDDEGNITQKEPDKGCGTLTDIDGNEYQTVIIGTQCWMAEDLRVKTLPNGTALSNNFPSIPNNNKTSFQNGRYYYEKPGDEVLGNSVLYPWSTATNRSSNNTNQTLIVQGICPDGWHVPSVREFATMFKAIDPDYNLTATYGENYSSSMSTISSNNRLNIKLCSPEGLWQDRTTSPFTSSSMANSPGILYANNDTTDPDWNASGFGALPKGYLDRKTGVYKPSGTQFFWTSISTSSYYARTIFVRISYNQTGAGYGSYSDVGTDFYPVRCVNDQTFPQE
ncbi:MAG: hypothetical protein J5719_00445 [Bacteroidales bacterium]|nr:hypothetical protein [Bacteroidales bacterium]